MKTLVQAIFMIAISSAAYSQDLTGEWKGSLSVQGTELRIVFHVNEVNGEYKATMDSPDQNATGIQVNAISFNYPDVKIEITTIGAKYEGNMSEKSINGKWNQANISFDLVLLKNDEMTIGE